MSISVFSEIQRTVKSVSDYLYPYKSSTKTTTIKNQKRMQLRELYKKHSDVVEENESSIKLIDWLKGLDRDTRIKVFTHKNPIMICFLHEMYSLKYHEGPHLFIINPPQPKKALNLHFSSIFSVKKKTFDELTHPNNKLEQKLEESIRFCDIETYCDCITIDPDLNINDFIHMINCISGDKAFQTPCRLSWDSIGNTWSWEYPQ